MRNFSFKDIGFTSVMNGMRTILIPKLLNLHSKLLEACALFGCCHISGYIKLSLVAWTWQHLGIQPHHFEKY